MKKAGAIVAIVLIALFSVSRSRLSAVSENTNTQPEISKQSLSSAAVAASEQKDSQPALAQLRAQVSEDKSEPLAEQSSFQNRLEDLITQMPTLNNQAKPETDAEGHIHGSIPEELIEARILGQLRKATYENPQHAARSQVVYAGCAERADFSNAVRAVCFMRALELSIKVKNPQTIAALEVPTQVRSLAQKLISKGKL